MTRRQVELLSYAVRIILLLIGARYMAFRVLPRHSYPGLPDLGTRTVEAKMWLKEYIFKVVPSSMDGFDSVVTSLPIPPSSLRQDGFRNFGPRPAPL